MSRDVAIKLEFQTSWRAHLGAHFRDVPSCCQQWNGKLTLAYTARIQLYLKAPHFCRRLTKSLSISKRGFLGRLESKPVTLLSSRALNFLSLHSNLEYSLTAPLRTEFWPTRTAALKTQRDYRHALYTYLKLEKVLCRMIWIFQSLLISRLNRRHVLRLIYCQLAPADKFTCCQSVSSQIRHLLLVFRFIFAVPDALCGAASQEKVTRTQNTCWLEGRIQFF